MSDDYIFTFGKYQGQCIENVPASYLLWCYEQDEMMLRHPEIVAYVKKNKKHLDEEVERAEELRAIDDGF